MSSPEPLCEALAGFTLVKFLVFYILANRFPNHRTARSSKPEYSLSQESSEISDNLMIYDTSDPSYRGYLKQYHIYFLSTNEKN